MQCFKKIFLLLIILSIGCSSNKSKLKKNWYKGNLHTHSYWSDGDEFPEVIMDWYKSHGYRFVALSDHNTLAEGEKWMTISEDSIRQNAFHNYLESYGHSWVQYRLDSLQRTQVLLKTYREYKELFDESEKFLIIQSEEITDGFDGKPLHLNATNIQKNIDPQGGANVVEVLQNNIDAVIRQKEDLGLPMIVHINHPNFGYAISLDDMIAISNERFFEVYNGHHMVHNMGDSTHISTETMWDLINIAYTKQNKPLMFGMATDDAHNYHAKGHNWSNAGRGWIMVYADSLDTHSIIEAMESGDFYASTGVVIENIEFENNILTVTVEKRENATYNISFVGCKNGSTKPEEFKSITGHQASFDLTGDFLFVRCKITSSKLQDNPIEDMVYETAWTQPVTPDNKME